MPGTPKSTLLRALGLALLTVFAAPGSATAFQLAPDAPHSPNAEDSALAWWVMLILTSIIFVVIVAALLRARAANGDGERRTLGTGSIQTRVGLGLGALALAVFIFGVTVTESARQVEATGSDGLQTAQRDLGIPAAGAPLEIDVSGQQWLWRFEYPDGTFSYQEMVVPVDTAVVLNLDSTDLHHRWWVPALGGQFDAIPGSTNHTWFKADEVGVYEGRSTEFSGPAFATMRAQVRVLETSEYEAWLSQQADDIEAAQAAVAEAAQPSEDSAEGETTEEGTAAP